MELQDLFMSTDINSLYGNMFLNVKQYKQDIWNYYLI